MSDDRDPAPGSEVWQAADAVFAGQAVGREAEASTVPASRAPLVRELQRIARVIAAHEECRRAPDEPASPSEAEGETWGPLVILEKIGTGAFGDVFRAREPRLDRLVALKFFRPDRLSTSQLTSDVIEEGRLLARVRHPNVVTVHGAMYHDGRFGIWMELVEGSTLEEIVAEQGPLSVTKAVAIGRDLCGALRALHEAGILHRDITARNVMREASGRVVLMDLGISCEVDGEVPIRQYGTPLYAAPEVLLDNRSSEQGDIYSLGVLLYYLVSGRHPITGSTLSDVHAAHESGQLESLCAVAPDLPQEFVRIVEKALAGDRNDRFATASEFEQMLADAVAGTAKEDVSAHGDSTAIRVRATTDNRQAYRLFLQGRHFWNQRYRGGLPAAIAQFRRAVELDPGFALAHVGIADCMNTLSYNQYVRPRDGFAEARASAERALELAPDLGEAWASLGWIDHWHNWDFATAEQHYRRAIQLCPHYGLARQRLALLLMTR